jgi:hypothetical protein
MRRILLATLMIAAVAFAAEAQSNKLKGPKYKNASPEVKYKGQSTIWVAENAGDLQGPEYKNYNKKNDVFTSETGTMTASIKGDVVLPENVEGSKVYAPLNLKDNKGINTKGLKGPRYKNYRSGK